MFAVIIELQKTFADLNKTICEEVPGKLLRFRMKGSVVRGLCASVEIRCFHWVKYIIRGKAITKENIE